MTHILIADDEPNILMLTEMLFQDMGMTVTTAVDGQDALEKTITLKPDLIITDVIMPNKSGFELCKEVRAHPEVGDTPIIILSALGDDYNKINGLEGGADDYMTKPFNVEELKARAKALMIRYKRKSQPAPHITESAAPFEQPAAKGPDLNIDSLPIALIPTKIDALDQCLNGGIPRGSNILLLGPTGSSKSYFARKFIAEGLKAGEKSLFVTLDDNPKKIRAEIERLLENPIQTWVASNTLRFVDAYSWTTFSPSEEKFSVSGMLDLNQLSGVISDAGYDLGQSVQHKAGGRRVIDSISSLLIHFDLSSVQRFLSQVARTAISFGDVTTFFIMEEGTVDEQVLNNIKYIMDGVLEFSKTDNNRQVRVSFMKWAKYHTQWCDF